MQSGVIIFSISSDTHVDKIIHELDRMEIDYLRIDSDTFSRFENLSISIYPHKSNQIETPLTKFVKEHKNIKVWIRRPFSSFLGTKKAQVYLQKLETDAVIRYLLSSLPKTTKFVSELSSLVAANQKIYQLFVAKEIGLKIPKTLITTSVQDAKDFYIENNMNIITKPLETTIIRTLEESYGIYTTKVSEDMDFTLINNCPTLLQENVYKKSELRVTVIGKKIFAVEIDSQLSEKSMIDWRRANPIIRDLPHRKFELPEHIEQKIQKLMDHYKLNFGAIDMAITPQGEYVFFEINPAGQFLWLEPLTGIPLAREMAEYLADYDA
ncbi:MAG: hypothetical protein U0525_00760 [Patescibacteria group bacterium]